MALAIRYFTKSKKGNTTKLAAAISEALGIEALDITNPLTEKVDTLFLANAMYAADIDNKLKNFILENKDNIGEIVNLNTAASGASTLKAVKKVAEKIGVKVSEKEFHCAASWIFINKGKPTEEDLERAKEFALSIAAQ